MRLLSLNLLTVSATAFILGLLTIPAMSIRSDPPSPPALPVPKMRAFGVYVDPWHIDDWTVGVGASPTIAAKFEAFSRRRDVDKFASEATRRGIKEILVSWEPWKPVKARLGVYRQSYPQRLQERRHCERVPGPLHPAGGSRPRELQRHGVPPVRP